MTSQKSALFLLVLISLLSAFNLSDYFYSNETNVTIAYTNFTVNGTNHSIVKFNGTETFLLRNNTMLTNQSDIDSLIYTYFVQTYYPTQTELTELRDAIKRFNDSRNDGYDFRNKEEYVCRNDVLLSNGKISVSGQPVRCVDEDSCERNALILFSVYGEALSLGSATTILPHLMNFTPSSLAMDYTLSNYTYKLDNLNENTLVETINYIKDTAGPLKNYSLRVESTLFRTPRLNDTADRTACTGKCWAICPSFDLDQAATDLIKSKATALSTKVAPLQNYRTVSTKIYNNTQARVDYLRNENTAEYYTGIFSEINGTGPTVISFAEETVAHVSNTTLLSKLDRLRALHSTIPEDIENRNFSTLDADISNYTSLVTEVNESATDVFYEYNETKHAKNIADSMIILLETKDLDPASMASFELLRNHTSDLDAEFRDGLTVPQLQSLRSNYTNATSDARELLQSESELPTTKALLLFRGFARRVNSGIANLASATKAMEPEDIPANSLLTFGGFSALLFLSLGSLLLLIFLYILGAYDMPQSRYIVTAAFLCGLILLLGFSIFMYLFLGKTSTNATFTEFLADFNSRNSTSILVDMRNVSYADAQFMDSCAKTLANTFTQKNKSWTIYALTPNACNELNNSGANATLTVNGCLEKVENESSSFMLGYADRNQPPQFSIIYKNTAQIRAGSDYYESCPLVALLS